MELFYPFGLSRVGRGVNGHQQKAINPYLMDGGPSLCWQHRRTDEADHEQKLLLP